MKYYETNSTLPQYNLAFEEYILENHVKDNILILWQNEPSVIVGRNQNTFAEINAEYINQKHIHVVRRQTGGGAVYHDLGNLNYSFITDYTKEQSFHTFAQPIIKALQGIGLDASASGRNDILVSGKKVSGTAQRIVGGRILHHGTLLFQTDAEAVSHALSVDPMKFRSKASQSVRSRIGNIKDFLQEDLSLEQFWIYLRNYLLNNTAERQFISDEEKSTIQKIQETRYNVFEWNYGRSPAFSYHDKKYFDGGILEVFFDAKEGRIDKISFLGDFLSMRDTLDISDALAGCKLDEESLHSALSQFNLEEYFGDIMLQEVISAILDLKGDIGGTVSVR